MKAFSFVILATLLFWPVAASAQLNVLISGGFSSAYEQLLPEFERAWMGERSSRAPKCLELQIAARCEARMRPRRSIDG
jgi:hypothetical protein